MNWRPIRGWTKPLHERGMKADSMPERLLIGPGSPPSIDPVYPELSPPPEPCPRLKGMGLTNSKRQRGMRQFYCGKEDGPSLTRRVGIGAVHAVAIGRAVLSIVAESLGADQRGVSKPKDMEFINCRICPEWHGNSTR